MFQSNGLLDDTDCRFFYNPVCKMSAYSSVSTTIRPQKFNLACPSNWTSHAGHCYKIFNTPVTQFQAEALCRENIKSSYLAEITNDEEFEWIQRFVQQFSNSSVWVNKNFFVVFDNQSDLFLVGRNNR